jgi:glycine/D-amino acid oxidase-like deaminating enzyme
MAELKEATVRLVGLAASGERDSPRDDLEVTGEALCFRPVARCGRPIVARIEDQILGEGTKMPNGGGVYIAAGHGPWGISLSLGTGKVMAEMLQGVQTSVSVDHLGMK